MGRAAVREKGNGLEGGKVPTSEGQSTREKVSRFPQRRERECNALTTRHTISNPGGEGLKVSGYPYVVND